MSDSELNDLIKDTNSGYVPSDNDVRSNIRS